MTAYMAASSKNYRSLLSCSTCSDRQHTGTLVVADAQALRQCAFTCAFTLSKVVGLRVLVFGRVAFPDW